MDNIEMAEDGMWDDEGPDDPDDCVIGPQSDMIRGEVVWVRRSKNREGKDVAVVRIRDENTKSDRDVRSVKYANELALLKPGNLIETKFLIHDNLDGTCFRNMVWFQQLGDFERRDGDEEAEEAEEAAPPRKGNVVVLSVDHPGTAYGLLVAERTRRRRFFWTQRNGDLIDVRDMTDEHLENTIEMLERIVTSNEAANVAAEEAYGGKEW